MVDAAEPNPEAIRRLYYPSSLDDILGQPKAVATLRGWLDDLRRGVPPLMPFYFVGPVSTGKTCTAYALGEEVLRIAEEQGVFASSHPTYEWSCSPKGANALINELDVWRQTDWPGGWAHSVFLIDEFDRFSRKDRILLRRVLEKAGLYIPIVITANLKVGDLGLDARFQRVDFVPLDKEASRALALKAASARGLRPSDARLREIVDEAKGNAREIFKRLGVVNPNAPKPAVPPATFTPPKPGSKGGRPRRVVDADWAIALRESGKSWPRIANEIGAPVSTVRRRVAETARRNPI